MDAVIKVSTNIQDLTGEGLEYLVRADGTVAAKFFNGNVMPPLPPGNQEVTIPTAHDNSPVTFTPR